MRTHLLVWISIGLLACGDGSGHPADGSSADSPGDTPPGGTTLTINSYGSSGPVNAQLIAVQDGDGPWTALAGTGGIYTTTLRSDHYAVMTACASGSVSGPSIYYAAISDGTTLYLRDCTDPGAAPATVTGSVTGAAAGHTVRVTDEYFGMAELPSGTTAYTLATVTGPQRLFATELAGARAVKLAAVQRTVTPGATVNFDLAAGFAPVAHALTGSSTIVAASSWFRDVNGTVLLERGVAPFADYRAVPVDKLEGGLNRLAVSSGTGIQVLRYFATPTDQTIAFPAPVALAQQPTASALPYPNAAFTVPVRADFSVYDLSFATTNPTTHATVTWFAELTSAYLAKAFPGAASVAYTAPDFRGLPGWQARFQAEAGLPLDWSITPIKYTDVAWNPSIVPGTVYDHDGSEVTIVFNLFDQLPAP